MSIQFGVTEEAVEPVGAKRGALAAVDSKAPWIASGLLLQIIGAAAPAAYVIDKAKHENLGGSITRATVRLAWHDSLHSHAGLAIMIVGALVFAFGASLLARPYVKTWFTLVVAIPVAAVAGVVLLGAAVLIIAVVVLIAWAGIDGGDWGGGGGDDGSGRRKGKSQQAADAGDAASS